MIAFAFAFIVMLGVWAQVLWMFAYFMAKPPLSSAPAKAYMALTRWFCLLMWWYPLWNNMEQVAFGTSVWDHMFGAIGVFVDLYWIWVMWKTRHDDDDFWRKAKKKLHSLVKVVGGKLVVVPAPQPAHVRI